MRTVLISDTHTKHQYFKVPDGDLLIHAGDLTNKGSQLDLDDFIEWFRAHPHKHKVFIAGNHDFCFERQLYTQSSFGPDLIYLEDSLVQVEGLNIYGSPWQPWFYNWAFNVQRGPALAAKWAKIPEDTDILITHGPPRGIQDLVTRDNEHAGCDDLLERVKIVKPKLHVFGHLHDGYGVTETDDTIFVNAAALDDRYRPVNSPIVLDYIDGRFNRV